MIVSLTIFSILIVTLTIVLASAAYAKSYPINVTCKDGTVISTASTSPTPPTKSESIQICGSHGYDGSAPPPPASSFVVKVTCKDGTVISASSSYSTPPTKSESIQICGSHGYDGSGAPTTVEGPGTTESISSVGGACQPGSSGLITTVFVPWYKYLPGEVVNDKCNPTFNKTDKGNYDLSKGVPLILFAIIEFLLRISGLIAIGYIIYGSIQYIMSQGQPENLKGAKSTITNAITGLVVVMLATGLVQFLGNAFK